MILKRVNELEKLTALIPTLANQNSQSSWNKFVQITSNDLHRYICYFLHDADHASDILQEVYIAFLRDKEIFNKIYSKEPQEIAAKKIYSWLYKTARNKSLDLIKKKKNGIAAKLILSQKSPTRESNMPTQNLEKKESNELIKYELSLLNEKQKNILTLKFFHEKSNLEIASEINCEVISVPKLIDRALAQLKKRLEKVGIIISMVMIGESLSNKAMCVDMPANILPEVFQLYKTVPVGGLFTKSITLKGILMKSLYTIVGATVISSLFFYLNIPTQEQKKTEISKKISQAKENSKTQKTESTKTIEITKKETLTETVVNEKAEFALPKILTYQLENSVITFKINSIPQLMEDYKKSPYFQFANSSATGSDFERIDFSKIYDLYNDGILNLILDASDLKKLFSTMKSAKSFELQSNLKTGFNLIFEFASEEEAQVQQEEINKWLTQSIEKAKNNCAKIVEENRKDLAESNPNTSYHIKITGGHESYYKTKSEKIGNFIYVFNEAKEIKIGKLNEKTNENICLKLKFNETLLKNHTIKTIAETLNVDTTNPLQVSYEFNECGLIEKINFEIKDETKCYFDKLEIPESINEYLKNQTTNNQILTQIKPNYIYSMIKMIGPNLEENFEQKLMLANLFCFQKFQKSVEVLIKESLTGAIIVNTDSNNTNFFLGLTKENKIKSILDALKNELSLPFQFIVTDDNFLKITVQAIFPVNNSTPKKAKNHYEKEILLHVALDTKAVFQDTIKERLFLAQKYSEFDSSVKNCIPLLTNDEIYSIFENPNVTINFENKKSKLIINSAIPYLFGFLFFESLSSEIGIHIAQEPTTAQNNNNKNNLPGETIDLQIASSIGVDNTLFSQHTFTNSETLELLYYDERGQLNWSYKKIKDTKNFLVERFNRSGKLIESYEMQNKVKNGEYRQFDNNGILYRKGTFLNGMKSGVWSFFSGDAIIGEIKYKDGHPASFDKKYPEGALEIKVELDAVGKGYGKLFFKNGQVQLEGDYINFKKVNTWKIYTSSGKTLTEIQYNLFGEKQKVITYYENQAKHFEVPFKDNLINGKVLEFYPDGKSRGEYQIEKGRPAPHWALFSSEGKVSGEWLADNSFTGIFKVQDDSEIEILYSLQLNNNESEGLTLLNNNILKIEGKLNLMYSRSGEGVISSINGPATISISKLIPNEDIRGLDFSSIVLDYGMLLNKEEIKESILYKINSWNNQLNQFIEDSNKNCFFLMNAQIIYKLYMENHKVKYAEFLEFSNELF